MQKQKTIEGSTGAIAGLKPTLSDGTASRTILSHEGEIARGIFESYMSVLPKQEGETEAHCIAGIRLKMPRDKFDRMRADLESKLEAARQRTGSGKAYLDHEGKWGYAEISLQNFPLKSEVIAESELLTLAGVIRSKLESDIRL